MTWIAFPQTFLQVYFDVTCSSHKWTFQTKIQMCFAKMYCNIFNPFPYRIVQAFVRTTVDYKSLYMYFCSNFPDFLMLSFWWGKNSVVSQTCITTKLSFSQLRSAFRNQAWLFAIKLGFLLPRNTPLPKNRATAEKQTDCLILLAKRHWPFAFT